MPLHMDGPLSDLDSWTAGDRCSIARALSVVGTRSTMLILREAFYGTTRFDDFSRRVGITDASSAARLKELVDAGIFVKKPYRPEKGRTRYEYVLTRMGEDLLPSGATSTGNRTTDRSTSSIPEASPCAYASPMATVPKCR